MVPSDRALSNVFNLCLRWSILFMFIFHILQTIFIKKEFYFVTYLINNFTSHFKQRKETKRRVRTG